MRYSAAIVTQSQDVSQPSQSSYISGEVVDTNDCEPVELTENEVSNYLFSDEEQVKRYAILFQKIIYLQFSYHKSFQQQSMHK